MADAMAIRRASGLPLSISFASAKANLLELRTTWARQASGWGFLAKSKNSTDSSKVTTLNFLTRVELPKLGAERFGAEAKWKACHLHYFFQALVIAG